MADKQALIDQLNVVLSWELAGAIQYLHHNAMIAGPERQTFAEFFHEGSEEAREHAELVATRITALGGIPTVEPAKIRQGLTLDEMLDAALALEEDALAAWEKAHQLSDGVVLGVTFWIEEMIAHEQEHVDELRKLTRRVGGAANASSTDSASTSAS